MSLFDPPDAPSTTKGHVMGHETKIKGKPGQSHRLDEEARRIDAVKRAGTAPEGTSPYINSIAPARGAVVQYRQYETITRADGRVEEVEVNHLRLAALRIGDAFDRTADACGRTGAPMPFSPGQISVGRSYAALVERYESAGVRCASIEIEAGVSSGTGGSFMDAVLRDGARLGRLDARIGNGMAMEVRRSKPGARRRAILDRALVRAFCLQGMTLADVLAAHGWAKKGQNIQRLRMALCAALDRMQGPAIRSTRSYVRYFGEMNPWGES